MTEDEAKTKWCPFVRHVWEHNVDFPGAYNRIVVPDPGANLNCVASDCMAWRWAAFAEGEEHAGNVHGYCGLAGK